MLRYFRIFDVIYKFSNVISECTKKCAISEFLMLYPNFHVLSESLVIYLRDYLISTGFAPSIKYRLLPYIRSFYVISQVNWFHLESRHIEILSVSMFFSSEFDKTARWKDFENNFKIDNIGKLRKVKKKWKIFFALGSHKWSLQNLGIWGYVTTDTGKNCIAILFKIYTKVPNNWIPSNFKARDSFKVLGGIRLL